MSNGLKELRKSCLVSLLADLSVQRRASNCSRFDSTGLGSGSKAFPVGKELSRDIEGRARVARGH